MSGYDTISDHRYVVPSLSSIFGSGFFNKDAADGKAAEPAAKKPVAKPAERENSPPESGMLAPQASAISSSPTSNNENQHAGLQSSAAHAKIRHHHRTGEIIVDDVVIVEEKTTAELITTKITLDESTSEELIKSVRKDSLKQQEMLGIGGAFSMQCSTGSHSNEDTYALVPNLVSDDANVSARSTVQLFAVFDGHGGANCSSYLRDHLHRHITQTSSFAEVDLSNMLTEGLKEAESKFFESFSDDNSGSCVAVCMVTPSRILLANIGDCRAVLYRKGGIISMSTTDHRAADTKEKERIEAAGGFVVRGRVFGLLAVSRSIGDREYKAPEIAGVVISEPAVNVIEIQAEHEFVILASDGVWDMVDTTAASVVVRKALFDDNLPPAEAAKQLVQTAVKKGSRDDVTAVVVKLVPVNRGGAERKSSSSASSGFASPAIAAAIPMTNGKNLDTMTLNTKLATAMPSPNVGDNVSQSSQSFVGAEFDLESDVEASS